MTVLHKHIYIEQLIPSVGCKFLSLAEEDKCLLHICFDIVITIFLTILHVIIKLLIGAIQL